MADVRVTVDETEVVAFFTTNPTMQAALGIVATAIKENGEQVSPYGTSLSWPKKLPGEPWIRRPMRHGRYQAAFRVRKVPKGWEVWNDDPFAMLVEWGSVKNPPYAPVRSAISRLGLKLRAVKKPT